MSLTKTNEKMRNIVTTDTFIRKTAKTKTEKYRNISNNYECVYVYMMYKY